MKRFTDEVRIVLVVAVEVTGGQMEFKDYDSEDDEFVGVVPFDADGTGLGESEALTEIEDNLFAKLQDHIQQLDFVVGAGFADEIDCMHASIYSYPLRDRHLFRS